MDPFICIADSYEKELTNKNDKDLFSIWFFFFISKYNNIT